MYQYNNFLKSIVTYSKSVDYYAFSLIYYLLFSSVSRKYRWNTNSVYCIYCVKTLVPRPVHLRDKTTWKGAQVCVEKFSTNIAMTLFECKTLPW